MAEILWVEGFMGLWHGLGSSLWLTCNPSLQFLVYESLKTADLAWRHAEHPPSLDAFVMGAAAKGCSVVLTYPLQVVQTSMRVPGRTQRGTVDALRLLWQDRGCAGLYAGLEA